MAGDRRGRWLFSEWRRAGLAAALAFPVVLVGAAVLRYFEDLTEAQTAQALGVSVGTVKSQTSKAMATMRVDPGLQETRSYDTPQTRHDAAYDVDLAAPGRDDRRS